MERPQLSYNRYQHEIQQSFIKVKNAIMISTHNIKNHLVGSEALEYVEKELVQAHLIIARESQKVKNFFK